MRCRRLPKPPERVLKKLQYAEPPGRLPRGFFDNLLEPTKALLDKGLSLAACADWLIEHRALPERCRMQFLRATHTRFTRLRAKKVSGPAVLSWKAALGYNSTHVVQEGRTVAICGATAARWMQPGEDARQCNKCIHQVSKQTLTIHREKA